MRRTRAVTAVMIALLVSAAGSRFAWPARVWAGQSFSISSSAFTLGGAIPVEFSCKGADRSPELAIGGVPKGAESLALIVEDPDAPRGLFTHWVLYDLPTTVSRLPAGIAKTPTTSQGALQGRNTYGRTGYDGPCPPSGPAHHYHFRLFALDSRVNLPPGASASELRRAMTGHVLAQTELMGTFAR